MEHKYSIKSIKAIIGLGNPGKKYYHTRHSIGFRLADALVQQHNVIWQSTKDIEYALIQINDHELYVIKPQTLMNNSGQIMSWLIKKGIKADQIIIMHDELEKKFGKLLITFSGSHKGHNGLRSIINEIGIHFWRLKFGIGRPERSDDVSNYVLENFTKNEEVHIILLIEQVLSLIMQ